MWYVSLSIFRAYSRLALSQWKASLQKHAVSHWLGANLGSAISSATTQPISHFPMQLLRRSVIYFITEVNLRLTKLLLNFMAVQLNQYQSPSWNMQHVTPGSIHWHPHIFNDLLWVRTRWYATSLYFPLVASMVTCPILRMQMWYLSYSTHNDRWRMRVSLWV